MTFDCEGDLLTGLYIIPTKDRMTTASMHGPDIDSQIGNLKAELNALGEKMKSAIRKQATKPLFGGE